jgi:predicted nucleic acid-binding protein
MTDIFADSPKIDIKSLSVCFDSTVEGRLDAAMNLWRINSKTLGRFPKGAFKEAANKGWIFYLLHKDVVVGYILYRFAKSRVAIAHFCVVEELRRQGAAMFLFYEFCNRVDDGNCRGIEVRCREDFEVERFWPKLGFQFAKSVPGRAKEGSTLSVWFRRFDVDDFFFDMQPKEDEDDLTWAVLDANVVFKLSMPDDPTSEESLSLVSDTVSPYARYFVTHEIFTEIQRKKDRKEKDNSTQTAKKFETVEAKQASIENFIETLKPLWKSIKRDRDRSDLKHVAITAAAGLQTFVTLDTEILEKADEIYELCSVRVMLPVEFVAQMDELENSSKYSPLSLARTQYCIRCPKPDELRGIAERFCMPHLSEKRRALEAKLRAHIANTSVYETIIVTSENENLEALISFRSEGPDLHIEIMRHSDSTASRTVSQNIIWDHISGTTDHQFRCIYFSDSFSQDQHEKALLEIGFFPNGEGLARISSNISEPLELVQEKLMARVAENVRLSPKVREGVGHFLDQKRRNCSNLEVAFWPLKITDSVCPTYLVPIQPNWAMNLFDKSLSEEDLFGADPGKHFNFENVYYRSARTFKAVPGARILWYVSSSKQSKVSAIRACSRLISMETAPAKTLFSKYRRLGIFEWRDLMDLTGGKPYGEVMALRFHQSECFKNPINLCDFSDFAIKYQPIGPMKLSIEQFANLYEAGMQSDEQ